MDIPTEWAAAVLYVLRRDFGVGRLLTRKEFVERSLPDVVNAVGCVGKTPAQTLSRVLQLLRDRGDVEFGPRAGTYKLLREPTPRVRRASHGELMVEDILKEMGLRYHYEVRFDWLRYDCPLRLDFVVYLPSLLVAIEFDGKQHDEPVEMFGGVEAWVLTQIRDRKKDRLLRDRGIPLLRLRCLHRVRARAILDEFLSRFESSATMLLPELHR